MREKKLAKLISLNFFQKHDDPEEQVIIKDEKSKVLKNLFMLNSQDRIIIILKDIDEFSIDEISAILSLPEGTVKSKLHRSRVKLADLLNGDTG